MKKFNFGLLSVFAIALAVAFLSSCGKDDEGDKTYTEADYVGTYYGKHVISDPTLKGVITGIDPTSDGSFLDTITVSTGASADDNIMEFTSTLLNGTTIQADISKKTGGNVVQLNIDSLRLSDSAQVDVKNVIVKPSSSVRGSGGNSFNVTFNLAGTVFVAGEEIISLPNIPTSGSFKK